MRCISVYKYIPVYIQALQTFSKQIFPREHSTDIVTSICPKNNKKYAGLILTTQNQEVYIMLTASETTSIIITTLQCAVIILGICLQIKTYFGLKKGKDLAWRIYIFHGVVAVIYFICCAFLQSVADFLSPLSDFTGTWFCHIAYLIKCFNILNTITPHYLTIN